ncbi:MAG: inositol monophosphatase family protein [Verrucomicrobiota bacterium]
MSVQLNELLKGTLAVASEAASFIRRERDGFHWGKVEVKGLNDLVSYVDKESEKMIVGELAKLLPEAGFIVEENSASGKKEYNWIVDPLDGTTNFVHGIPCYAVSIALEYRGEIVLGVVHEVSRNECFYAAQEKGAFLNGTAISVSTAKTLGDSLIATGFPIQNFERQENYMGALLELMKRTHGLRRIGAASVDLCYVACGRMDAYYEYNLNAWDVAAGALIVQEAGGVLTDFKGGDDWLFGRECVATNRYLEQEFASVIKRHFIERQ